MALEEGIPQAALDAGLQDALDDLQIAELKAAFSFYDVHDSGDIPCTDLMTIFRTQLHWSCPTPWELTTMAVELELGGSWRRLNFCEVLLVILAWTRHANCRALAPLPISHGSVDIMVHVHGISWFSGKGASDKGKGVAKSAGKGVEHSRSRSRSPPAIGKGKGKSRHKNSPTADADAAPEPPAPGYLPYRPLVGLDRSALDDILDGLADRTSGE